MNIKPIEFARDPDLQGSLAAMHRAAKRAREVARRTGTRIVIVIDGVLEHLDPDELANSNNENAC